MDSATQQNAALVEEMAAAASSLKSQAQELVQLVAVLKLSSEQGAAGAFRPVAPAAARTPRRSVAAHRRPGDQATRTALSLLRHRAKEPWQCRRK